MVNTDEMAEKRAAGEQLWVGAEAEGVPLLIESESGDVAWLRSSTGEPCREGAESKVYPRRIVAAWNACLGIPTEALNGAGIGAVAAVIAPLLGNEPKTAFIALADILSLVRQAASAGGVGEHEFTRQGGWRDRANLALTTLSSAFAEGHTEVEALLSEAKRVLQCDGLGKRTVAASVRPEQLDEDVAAAIEALQNVPQVGEVYDQQHSDTHMRAMLTLQDVQAMRKGQEVRR